LEVGIVLLIMMIGFVYAVDANVSSDVASYLEKMIERQGVSPQGVSSIVPVDKSRLPSAIDVNKIDENQVEIYQMEYIEDGSNKSVYVVSFSATSFGEISSTVQENYQYLTFNGNSAGFLNEYVMIDSGSIVGVSSSIKYSGSGDVDIEVYRNGISTGFMNEISSDGDSYDFDLQSDNMNIFELGDRISVKVVSYGGINIEEVNAIAKVKV
jgi:hypothetical protein